jgi:hypothetical protein
MIGDAQTNICTLIFNGSCLDDSGVCGQPAVRIFQAACGHEHIWWEAVCAEHEEVGERFFTKGLPAGVCARCGLENEVPFIAREVT